MKKFNLLLALVLSLLFLFSSVHAERTVWYVHPDSTLNSIQAALDSCADNDIVLVAPSTYYENITWPNKQGIQLISTLGPDITIIDGGGMGTVITMLGGDLDTTTIISGFTIRNGLSEDEGGGIRCRYVDPTIRANNITGNTALEGGGLFFYSCMSIVINNTITGNTTNNKGGGIYCAFSYLTITDNLITWNTADFGGGIYCSSFSSPTITGNTIYKNSSTNLGGGIYCYQNSSPTIDSCSISSNNGEGVYSENGSNPLINYNDIINNSGYGIRNEDSTVIINAEYNWWGKTSGPFHPDSNPGGQGDTVSNWVDFIPWLTGPVGVKREKALVHKTTDIRLICHPNPFATSTTISFTHKGQRAKGIDLQIFDVTGRRIRNFILHPSSFILETAWDGRDETGKVLPPGIYFLKLNGKPVGKVLKVR